MTTTITTTVDRGELEQITVTIESHELSPYAPEVATLIDRAQAAARAACATPPRRPSSLTGYISIADYTPGTQRPANCLCPPPKPNLNRPGTWHLDFDPKCPVPMHSDAAESLTPASTAANTVGSPA